MWGLDTNTGIEIFKLLLDAGIDVNAVDKAGFSVLHFAVRHNYLELVAQKEFIDRC